MFSVITNIYNKKSKGPTVMEYRVDVCRVTLGAHIGHLLVVKKNFFSFSVAVNNSIKVGPLVFLL